jgi:hypothetical protein
MAPGVAGILEATPQPDNSIELVVDLTENDSLPSPDDDLPIETFVTECARCCTRCGLRDLEMITVAKAWRYESHLDACKSLSLRMRYGAPSISFCNRKTRPSLVVMNETPDLRGSCCQPIGFVPYLCEPYPFYLRHESIRNHQDNLVMMDLQSQVNARVSAFVAEITELARHAAYEMLASSLDQKEAGTRGRAFVTRGATSRRKGAKRTADELAGMADAFLAYIGENPGQRMEVIARQLGYETQELTLPVKKLLASGRIWVEGQKRATSYYLASPGAQGEGGRGKTRSRGKGRQGRGKRS